MKRKASVQWQGDLKTGKGTVSTESGVLENTPYSFTARFASGKAPLISKGIKLSVRLQGDAV